MGKIVGFLGVLACLAGCGGLLLPLPWEDWEEGSEGFVEDGVVRGAVGQGSEARGWGTGGLGRGEGCEVCVEVEAGDLRWWKLDGDRVWWLNTTGLYWKSLSGGMRRTYREGGRFGLSGVDVDEKYVWWVVPDPNGFVEELWRGPKDGGAAEKVGEYRGNEPTWMGVVGGTVVVTDGIEGMWRWAGDHMVAVETPEGTPGAGWNWRVQGAALYWVGGVNRVSRWTLEGGVEVLDFSGWLAWEDRVVDVAAKGGALYLAVQHGTGVGVWRSEGGRMWKLGEIEGRYGVVGMAVNDRKVWVGDEKGELWEVGVGGGVVGGVRGVRDVWAWVRGDEDGVWWATVGGPIKRVRR